MAAALALIAASATLGGRWLLEQPLFRVQHVTVIGLHHESLNQVLAASGLQSHPSMLDVSSTAIRHKLESFAWIEGVTVHKHWPNSIVIDVSETHPVAVAFAAGHALRYVDERGRDLGPAPLHANLPTLLYVGPRRSSWPYAGAALGSAQVASQLPPAFSHQVSVITENSRGSVRLEMTTPVTFILGPPTNLQAKFVAVASVIAHSTLSPGDVVDVTVPDELSVSGGPPAP